MQSASKLAVLWAALALQFPTAHADVITCQFTEPFISIIHNTTNATLQVSGLDLDTEEHEEVGLAFTNINTLHLSWADKRLQLTLDYQGTDLMSDNIYPISARYFHSSQDTNGLMGGCQTQDMPMITLELD